MIGAIAGDIIGSIYENRQADRLDFPLFSPKCTFTDDTVLSIATADALLTKTPFVEKYKEYFYLYPHAGYGGAFRRWASSPDMQPYNSFGNGSAMRVSPIAYFFDDLDSVLNAAAQSAECTHNHPEGIGGAQAVAAAIFLARTGHSKDDIRKEIETRFGYSLSESVQYLHCFHPSNATCQGSVPHAMISFLESENFESTIRNAIYIGGDSDTNACMAGGIAEAYYGGVPESIKKFVYLSLDSRLSSVVRSFLATIGSKQVISSKPEL